MLTTVDHRGFETASVFFLDQVQMGISEDYMEQQWPVKVYHY